MMRYAVICCLLLGSYLVRGAPSLGQEAQQPSLFEEALNLYSSCAGQDVAVCLKLRALGLVDRAARAAEINIVDGLKLVKSEDAKNSRADNARSLNDLEASLPTDKEARETAVDEAIIDRTARFLSTHTLEVSYPEDKTSRSMDEARGKKKKLKALLPIFLLLKLKALALVPILIGGLALLAFKALVIGKIALVISAILAFQKLFGNKGTTSFEGYSHPVGHDDHHHHDQGWARAWAGSKPADQ